MRFDGNDVHFTRVDFRGADAWFDDAVFAARRVSFKDALIDPKQKRLLINARSTQGISADWGPFDPPPRL